MQQFPQDETMAPSQRDTQHRDTGGRGRARDLAKHLFENIQPPRSDEFRTAAGVPAHPVARMVEGVGRHCDSVRRNVVTRAEGLTKLSTGTS